jgi:predicted CoA-binding protein
MSRVPDSIAAFLRGRRIAVAGVSRDSRQPANAIFRKLTRAGYDVVPVNPRAETVEGAACHRDIASVPGTLDGVVIVTAPNAALEVVRQCAARGVTRVWFHRSFGDGSVSDEAVKACAAKGIEAIVGGCPMMFCEPIDVGHNCMKWWLQHQHRVPA